MRNGIKGEGENKEAVFAEFLIEQFKEYRNNVDWKASQSAWADYLGVNTSTLSTWMLGRRLPAGENIHLLARHFGMVVYDILGEPRRVPDDPNFDAMLGIFYQLQSEEQEKVIEFAKQLEESQK